MVLLTSVLSTHLLWNCFTCSSLQPIAIRHGTQHRKSVDFSLKIWTQAASKDHICSYLNHFNNSLNKPHCQFLLISNYYVINRTIQNVSTRCSIQNVSTRWQGSATSPNVTRSWLAFFYMYFLYMYYIFLML